MEIASQMVEISAPDGKMSAFTAAPTAPGRYPAVIVVMEAFGLNEHIKNVAKRIAGEGYVTLAPDMYYREKNAVVGYDALPEAIRLMTTLQDDKIVGDVTAAVAHLKAQQAVRADRVGITGFCMGGRISFLTACESKDVKASAPFYGGGIGGLLGRAEKIACPMLLFFGDQDPFIPNPEVDQIRATLAKLGKPAEVKVYAGAQHGFFCDERASYHAEAAADAWKRLMDFFGRHLKS